MSGADAVHAVDAASAGNAGNTADAARAVLTADAARTAGGGLWPRGAGLAGLALGVVAAGVAVERLTVHRAVRREARGALDVSGPYGTLRGTPGTVAAEDGTELYYEIDERDGPTGFAGAPDAGAAGRAGDGTGGPRVPRAELTASPAGTGDRLPGLLRLLHDPGTAGGTETAGGTDGGREGADGPGESEGESEGGAGGVLPTVVFAHGYCLDQDSWHFQRAALRGVVRAVYWDQRSHGRSGRAPEGEPVTIEQLGRDLKRVLDAAVPEGPVVLVGHSMGGMTVMALAEQYPRYVAERVAGVALVGTSAGGMGEVTYGLPAAGVRAVRRAVPGVLRALASRSELVERGRRATADLFAGLVRRYSFGNAADVDPGVARFAERMIESVPVDVVAEFYPAFGAHEKTAALAAFDGIPALVLAGDRDLITPWEHGRRIARALPSARFATLEGAGHLLMLERPREVGEHLARLLARTIRTHGSTAPPASGRARGAATLGGPAGTDTAGAAREPGAGEDGRHRHR
ncbi:alpha/beta fold hydrolase [Streptomyces cacaoi]|uniref:alpha/beta fold hydrolase n=1 Tax=Streptomyces cacaoi TaxID=1898 RepID=UPI0011F15B7B|nr:alpha/beta hydrolase [Streptomyces cacaoi]